MIIYKLYIFTLFFILSSGLNILILFPHPGKSHFNAFAELAKELARKGHKVTMVSHFPLKKPMQNYEDIDLQTDDDKFVEFLKLDDVPRNRFRYYWSMQLVSDMIPGGCKTLKSEKIKELLKRKGEFDLILYEMFISDCYLGLAHYFDIPIVGMSSCTVLPWSAPHFGNPEDMSYIPNIFLPFR